MGRSWFRKAREDGEHSAHSVEEERVEEENCGSLTAKAVRDDSGGTAGGMTAVRDDSGVGLRRSGMTVLGTR